MKFPQDSTYGNLSEAVANYDLKEMEVTAHTLKGLAGNLGFTDLFHACGEMVTAIRERTPDQGPDDFQLLFSNIQTPYEQIITCIKALDD